MASDWNLQSTGLHMRPPCWFLSMVFNQRFLYVNVIHGGFLLEVQRGHVGFCQISCSAEGNGRGERTRRGGWDTHGFAIFLYPGK